MGGEDAVVEQPHARLFAARGDRKMTVQSRRWGPELKRLVGEVTFESVIDLLAVHGDDAWREASGVAQPTADLPWIDRRPANADHRAFAAGLADRRRTACRPA